MMKAKYVLMVLVVGFMGMMVVNAQARQGRKGGKKRMLMEQRLERKCQRLIGVLALDDANAAKFSDVYMRYVKEINDVRKGNGKKGGLNQKEGKRFQMPTDAEVEDRLKGRFAQNRKILDINEKFYEEFREFLSPKQVGKIFKKKSMNRARFKKNMKRRRV